ncbi:hypothetical protein QFC22_003145 [Naganishia vaughanmartiniae]|uniref:Uncharacterized protein n=1 Tax=Naganishia vaughanmartiniae TaxID=1424756 RepID=A0ACC2X9H1_9TREE|nr:hypothetical protein QFC22_003145 [Naganishia vaughanmartiniae]
MTLNKQPTHLSPIKIAGRHSEVSINDIKWDIANPDKLYFLSDETGYANLWFADLSKADSGIQLATKSLPHDLGEPMWKLGRSWYAIVSEDTALVAPLVEGKRCLHHLHLLTGVMMKLNNEYCDVSNIHRVSSQEAIFSGGKYNSARKVVLVTLGTEAGQATFRELDCSADLCSESRMAALGEDYISEGEHITLSTFFQPRNSQTAVPTSRKVDLHVTLYSPLNPEYCAPDGQLPPALVMVHSGPTSRNPPTLKLLYQYFTTRGFAIVDVDYGGSSGYGREYQSRLNARWGEVDVYDVSRAVVELGRLGKIDKDRVAIRGSSAGKSSTKSREKSAPRYVGELISRGR